MIGVCYHLTCPWAVTAFLGMCYEEGCKYSDRQNENGGESRTHTKSVPCPSVEIVSVQPEFLWNPLCDSPEQLKR